MRAGPHRHARAIDDCRNIVRMRALEFERDDRPLVPGGAEDTQRIDLAQTLVGVTRQLRLVGADPRLADRSDVIDGGAKPDGLDDRGRAGLEFVRRIAVSDVVLEY